MSLKELRISVLDRLADGLESRGFRRHEQSFRRPIVDGWASFHMAFINHVDDFDVTGDVAVRYDDVEDLLNARRPNLSPREKRATATIGAQLVNIAGVGQQRWTVTSSTDVDPAVHGLLKSFEQWGGPFLERFSSRNETLRVLTEDGPEARLICPLPDRRTSVREALRALSSSTA